MKKSTAVGIVTAAATLAMLGSTPAAAEDPESKPFVPGGSATKDGCYFLVAVPKPAGTTQSGHKVYSVTVQAQCEPGRKIAMRTEAWEQDLDWRPGDPDTADDLLGSWLGSWSNWKNGEGWRYYTNSFRVPRNESDGVQELYHRAHLRVTSDNGVDGTLSDWIYTGVVHVPH